MKVKTLKPEIKSLNYLTVAYDVSKYKHNYYARFESNGELLEIEGEISNKMEATKAHFSELRALQKEHGFDSIHIACESTGGYEKALLRLAQNCGFIRSYVSGEATNKAKVIESNDSGKNDFKDARVIHMLAVQGKVLTCRTLGDDYDQLKFYNSRYEDYSLEASRVKNRISQLVDQFFPELQISANRLYSKTVSLVMECYGLNPYLIGELYYEDFLEELTNKRKKALHKRSFNILKTIWEASEKQVLADVEIWQIESLAEELSLTYNRYQELCERKEHYKKLMEDLAIQSDEWQKVKESPMNLFMFSRIIAETGAWKGFLGIKQLWRYAGLNLRERQSGISRGRVRLSKKGNSLLRKCLGQMCYSTLIKEKRLFGEYYQKKKEKRNGFYALVCVMRKTLKMLFGLYKSKKSFQTERVFDQGYQIEELSA